MLPFACGGWIWERANALEELIEIPRLVVAFIEGCVDLSCFVKDDFYVVPNFRARKFEVQLQAQAMLFVGFPVCGRPYEEADYYRAPLRNIPPIHHESLS